MQEPTIPATQLQLLQRIWHASFGPYLKWDEAFTISQGLPYAVVEQAPALGLTLEQVGAALECWRSNMIRAVDEVVARHMAEAKDLLR